MLGVVGDSAAGKTTLTQGLAALMGVSEAALVCTDDYHKYSRTERRGLNLTALHPDNNYLDIVAQVSSVMSPAPSTEAIWPKTLLRVRLNESRILLNKVVFLSKVASYKENRTLISMISLIRQIREISVPSLE